MSCLATPSFSRNVSTVTRILGGWCLLGGRMRSEIVRESASLQDALSRTTPSFGCGDRAGPLRASRGASPRVRSREVVLRTTARREGRGGTTVAGKNQLRRGGREGKGPYRRSANFAPFPPASAMIPPRAAHKASSRRVEGNERMSACPQCGTVAKPTDKFCNTCGTPVVARSASQPQAYGGAPQAAAGPYGGGG